MLRRIFIKYKIWRLKNQLDILEQDKVFYFLKIETRNIRHFDGQLDTVSMTKDFEKFQEEERKKILVKIKELKEKLK